MALCPSCIAVLRNGQTNKIHSTCRSFLAAVDEGCYICQGLFSQVPEEWKQKILRQAEISEPPANKQRKLDDSKLTWFDSESMHTKHGSLWLSLSSLDEEAYSHWLPMLGQLGLKVYRVAAKPLSWTINSSSTSSDETFTKLKGWLSRCRKTHNKCRLRRKEADVGWHPTRLIEVALSHEIGDNTNHLKCRIVEPDSENMPQNLRYITLSHRWPQDQRGFQKLTAEKLLQWKARLPVETLWRTFCDAFFVAKKLGISYVWIDSLCIIQDGDNDADWRKESPMMQKVYSNAEFNICASRKDHNGGLFSPRYASGPQPLQVSFPRPGGINDHAILDSGYYLIRKETPVEIWDARMKDSPLASRGWVFQEQLLSRANVHFADHEVLYECPDMRASETLGSDKDYQVSWNSEFHPEHFLKAQLPIPAVMERQLVSVAATSCTDDDRSGLQKISDDYMLWDNLLSQYTTRQLTKSEDWLVALSGVAQYFKDNIWHDDYYIAGLWRSRLAADMLWQLMEAMPREDRRTQMKRRRHLTFSWASVGGEVWNYADTRRNPNLLYRITLANLDIIKYRSFPKALDATGCEGEPFMEDIFSLPAIPTIEIRLTGFLRPMSLERLGPDISTSRDKWPTKDKRTRADSDLLIRLTRDDELLLNGDIWLDFEISSSELTALNKSGRLFLMPLVGDPPAALWLLLLEHVETDDEKDMERFRRIGVQVAYGNRGPGSQYSVLLSPVDYFSELSCSRYDPCSKSHTIFVI